MEDVSEGRPFRTASELASGSCPNYHSAIELIGKRWNGVVLRCLAGGAVRFSELRTSIPGITDAMLTQRLRELEGAGILDRHVVSTRPIDIRYSPTEVGASLSPILDAVASWSNEWAPRDEAPARREALPQRARAAGS